MSTASWAGHWLQHLHLSLCLHFHLQLQLHFQLHLQLHLHLHLHWQWLYSAPHPYPLRLTTVDPWGPNPTGRVFAAAIEGTTRRIRRDCFTERGRGRERESEWHKVCDTKYQYVTQGSFQNQCSAVDRAAFNLVIKGGVRQWQGHVSTTRHWK